MWFNKSGPGILSMLWQVELNILLKGRTEINDANCILWNTGTHD